MPCHSITTQLVALDADFGSTTQDVIRHLAGLITAAGRT